MPIAALNNQVVFKKLLSDEEILKAFIKDFLDIDLTPPVSYTHLTLPTICSV